MLHLLGYKCNLYTGIEDQFTGYSINLAGGRITLLAMAFPFSLINLNVIKEHW